jgi:Arc-like DNA binding domain
MSPKTIVHVRVRMPVAFHRKLTRDAERSGQTLNAEILRRLEDSYRTVDTTFPTEAQREFMLRSAEAAGNVYWKRIQEAFQEGSARTEERLRRLEAKTEERVNRTEGKEGKGDDKTTTR